MKIHAVLILSFVAVGAYFGLPGLAGAGPPGEEKKRTVERLGERVSRGVIQEGLETLDKPENRARLGRVLNSPEMREVVHDLAAALVIGVVDGAVTSRAGGRSNVEVGDAIRKSIDRQLTPAMGRLVARMVDSALDAALTDEHISGVEALGERATHAAIRGVAKGLEHELGPALAATLEKDLGPALARVIENDLLPAIGRGLDTPEMQQVVADLTRSFAIEFVAGAGDAIDIKAAANRAEGKESGFQLFGDKVAFGYTIAMFVAFAFGSMVIVLTVILLRNSRRLRKQSEAATQREAALMNLIDSLESDHPQLKADLRGLLEDQLEV